MSSRLTRPGALGSFLRARRGLVSPRQAGVIADDGRQVPGLRREEVAVLAGVSVDYYVRLEQGRERRPSRSVVDGIARALMLDGDSHSHLIELAADAARSPAPVPDDDTVERLTNLVDGWDRTPAMVVDATLTVLARNSLARALWFGVGDETNLARLALLSPSLGDLVVDRDEFARCAVATMRAAAVGDTLHPALEELIGELTDRSELFRRLWAQHEVHRMGSTIKQFCHPMVGRLDLRLHVLLVADEPGLQLWVYQAEPGTQSERSLGQLARA